jgi:phage terminase large subunit GpA-like protein
MSEVVDISKHVLEEVRGLRVEVLSGQREHRDQIEKMRERQNQEWSMIHQTIAALDLKVTERNEQRQSDHKALAQRVTMYAAAIAAGVSMAAAIAVEWAKDFFFR